MNDTRAISVWPSSHAARKTIIRMTLAQRSDDVDIDDEELQVQELCGVVRCGRPLTPRLAPVIAIAMPLSRASIMTVHQNGFSSPPSMAGMAMAIAIATPPAINHVTHRRGAG